LAEHLPSSTDTVDENKAKCILAIRGIVMQTMTLHSFNHGVDKDMFQGSTYEKVICKSVECSVTDIGELFPTGRLEDWKTVPDTVVFAKIVALCEFYRLHSSKKQLLTKYVNTAMVHLISMSNHDDDAIERWRVIGDLIQEDCQSDKDELAWMIRLLDAYVVYIGAVPELTDVVLEDIGIAMQVGVATILETLQVSANVESSRNIKKIESSYALGNFVTVESNLKVEQEQVRKIFCEKQKKKY
jgi:hypothetical protein